MSIVIAAVITALGGIIVALINARRGGSGG